MKEVKAIVQPGKLAKIREEFSRMSHFPGMTVGKVEGCSHHENPEVPQSLREALTDFSPKVRIEIITPDDRVEEIVTIIHNCAHTSRTGDGIVWVTPVETFHRLRYELE
ncbi:MAG: P-II family nitrogen regulator [Methylotetracoccus sp.]|nr:P-II family nitrogen regulator [Methylotetracoccus sp.]